tara:strand:+ start:1980 stop:2714 length:735 start_codon:yes stop_codon:yes gene_type:complete
MVNIDTVYQRVLALANKEQRGYITPQEYNLLANQAQMQIFESYFYTKNARRRLDAIADSADDETNIDELLGKKLGPFLTVQNVDGGTTYPTTVTVGTSTPDVFQTGRVFYNNQECTRVDISEARFATSSIRHRAALPKRPIFSDSHISNEDIRVYTDSPNYQANGVTVECFRVPLRARWTYVVVNGKALYNASDSSAQNFELHRSEEDSLVNTILDLAGIVIAKPGLSTLASQKIKDELGLQNS